MPLVAQRCAWRVALILEEGGAKPVLSLIGRPGRSTARPDAINGHPGSVGGPRGTPVGERTI
jgi:hypothetical protein